MVKKLWAAIFAVLLLRSALDLPESMRFDFFLLGDAGATLKLDKLITMGLLPRLNFGYYYGLLPIWAGRGWFGAFGRTPAAFMSFMVLCNAAMAWGLARLASSLRFGKPALLLLFVALPHAVMARYASFTHSLEAALLCLALGEHAAGKRGRALALSTAAVLTKPSLGYLYGLFLVVAIALRARGDRRVILRAVAPAAAVGIALGAALAAYFGVGLTLSTLFPASAAAMYKVKNTGFFTGFGREFWYFPGVRPGYYFGTVVAFWFAATFTLVAWCASFLSRRRFPLSDAEEVALACILLHLCFVCFFYGAPSSWATYSYILVAGTAVAVENLTLPRLRMATAAALALLALVGHRTMIERMIRGWREDSASSLTAGLWATPETRDEWSKILDLSHSGKKVFFLEVSGAADVLFPSIAAPSSWFLQQYVDAPGEVARVLGEISSADLVVTSRLNNGANHEFLSWPEFEPGRLGLVKLRSTPFFDVFERKKAP